MRSALINYEYITNRLMSLPGSKLTATNTILPLHYVTVEILEPQPKYVP
jgi:hypothetical protein